MQFHNLSEALQMDGHGIYVWSCVGICLLVLGANLFWSLKSLKKSRLDVRHH